MHQQEEISDQQRLRRLICIGLRSGVHEARDCFIKDTYSQPQRHIVACPLGVALIGALNGDIDGALQLIDSFGEDDLLINLAQYLALPLDLVQMINYMHYATHHPLSSITSMLESNSIPLPTPV